jgi:hypothetical protein
LSLKIKKI